MLLDELNFCFCFLYIYTFLLCTDYANLIAFHYIKNHYISGAKNNIISCGKIILIFFPVKNYRKITIKISIFNSIYV